MLPYIKSDDHITILLDGGAPVTVYSSEPIFQKVLDAVKAEDIEAIQLLTSPAQMIEHHGEGKVTVRNGEVLYMGEPLHNVLTDRILKMLGEGFNIEPMLLFLGNLMDNPSKRAVDELYSFLEYGKLPITDDGHFLAYKNVRQDFMDIHSGTFDNSPGSICEMPRNTVDEDKNRTCSAGLHFCSKEYLASFPGRTVVLKINPRDVVAIPADYNNTKGRCCRYEVLSELATLDRDITDVPVWVSPLDEDDASREEIEIEFVDDTDFDCGCGTCTCMDDPDHSEEAYIAGYIRGYKAGRGKKAREFHGHADDWDGNDEAQGYCHGYSDGRARLDPYYF